jgi:hypothetical protein
MPKKKKNPKIYISNWSSHKTDGHHGPGRKFSIMVRTSQYAKPDGRVPALVPRAKDLWEYKNEEISIEEYRSRYFKQILQMKDDLKPGKLTWEPFNLFSDEKEPVKDGDTLCCVCSRAQAAKGECHRAWAAVVLQEAGWTVVLDGVELQERID